MKFFLHSMTSMTFLWEYVRCVEKTMNELVLGVYTRRVVSLENEAVARILG
jgi:hypothetical protein